MSPSIPAKPCRLFQIVDTPESSETPLTTLRHPSQNEPDSSDHVPLLPRRGSAEAGQSRPPPSGRIPGGYEPVQSEPYQYKGGNPIRCTSER
jgi:hypothetical protein